MKMTFPTLAITWSTTSHICRSSFYVTDPTLSKRFIMPVFTAANCYAKKMVSGRANFDAHFMAGVGTLMVRSKRFRANGIFNIRKPTMHVCHFLKSRSDAGADSFSSTPTLGPNHSKISSATYLITSHCFLMKSATSQRTSQRFCVATGRSLKKLSLRLTTSSQRTLKSSAVSATATRSTTSSVTTRGQSHRKDLRVRTCKVCPSFQQLKA